MEVVGGEDVEGMWDRAWELEMYCMGCGNLVRLIQNEVDLIHMLNLAALCVTKSQKERLWKRRKLRNNGTC